MYKIMRGRVCGMYISDERHYRLPTNAQTNESTPKTSGLGHHWKCGNYAWQKTINKSAFQPVAAAVSCGETEARRSWSAGVEKRATALSFPEETSTLLMNQQCNVHPPNVWPIGYSSSKAPAHQRVRRDLGKTGLSFKLWKSSLMWS